MLAACIRECLKVLFPACRLRSAGRGDTTIRPRLEALEDRAVPATVVWDGGGATNNWSDRFNWEGDAGPVSGDDLVFRASAARLTNSNNFPSGTRFNSLTFSGSGYTISGGSLNQIILGAGGISNTATSGSNHYNGPIQTDSSTDINVDVVSGGTLQLGGALSGSLGLVKTGLGTLQLDGPDANTYMGFTKARGGLLRLNKGATGQTAVAVPGDLLIFSGTDGNTFVQEFRNDQIADDSNITIRRTTSFRAALRLINNSDTIGNLDLRGGEVDSPLGVLTMNGPVFGQATDIGNGTFATATIKLSKLLLGSNLRQFSIDPSGAAIDLSVQATLSGTGGLVKDGTGVLELVGDQDIGLVDIRAGTLIANGNLPASIEVDFDGRFVGGAQVGNLFTTGGRVVTVDDSSSGFTKSSGWSTVNGPGFGNEIIRAKASAVSKTVETATWSFTGLSNGVYRVFATWTGAAANSTKVRYSIFDGATTLRSAVFVDQERAPVNGPRDGGVVFQQLAGAVDIRSGALRVSTNNLVDNEADGANVVADAIRIERLGGTVNPGGGGTPKTLTIAGGTLDVGSTYRVDFQEVGPEDNAHDEIVSNLSFTGVRPLLEVAASSFSPPAPGTPFHIITQTSGGFGRFSNLPSDGDTIEVVAGDGQRHTFSIDYTPQLVGAVDLVYQNTATQVRDLKLSPDVINEGERVTLRGALTDPNRGDVLSLRVDWGDGTIETFTDLGTKPFHFTHTYADNSPPGSPYLVRVDWFDQHGAGKTAKLFVTVNNVPPRLFLGGAAVIRAGEVMLHTGTFADPGADAWTATVDYGDGSGVQPLALQPGKSLRFEYRYPKPGKYRVTVTVFDDDGGLSTDTFLVIVLSPL